MFAEWVWTLGEYDRYLSGMERKGITLKGEGKLEEEEVSICWPP
jgi:hypothetical protein